MRAGKNGRHLLVGLLRQSVFGRLAGYEDVNDADRLCRDPAMRWVVGDRAISGCAASAKRFAVLAVAGSAAIELPCCGAIQRRKIAPRRSGIIWRMPAKLVSNIIGGFTPDYSIDRRLTGVVTAPQSVPGVTA
jgi:Transposase DDE domain group 1